MTIKQQLAELCNTHGLKRLEVAYDAGLDRIDVWVQRGSHSASDNTQTTNFAEAFNDALRRLNGDVE